jgi:hypothetical protein
MKPTVGRIVHYQSYGSPGGEYRSLPRAAVITQTQVENRELGDGVVGLAILNPTGMYFSEKIPYAETPTPGHWSWPPRV